MRRRPVSQQAAASMSAAQVEGAALSHVAVRRGGRCSSHVQLDHRELQRLLDEQRAQKKASEDELRAHVAPAGPAATNQRKEQQPAAPTKVEAVDP